MNASVAQWIGNRETQEDAYGVKYYPEGVLAVVCDGMGGHLHGALASHTAVDAFMERFDQAKGTGPVSVRLKAALEYANKMVGSAFAKCGAFGGTTLVAAWIGAGVIWWVSVGDSPLFLWRHRRLIRLNEDHSMRAVYLKYVKEGGLTYDEAMSQGHLLRSALTGEPLSLVDAPPTPYPLLPGDRILLTSDGTDELLQIPALAESTRNMLSCRKSELSPRVIEAVKALRLPVADNVTAVSFDWP